MKKKICIFGGSSSGIKKEHEKLAITIGQIIAENNFDIVFGGGENGIMGAIAKSSISFGAKTIGIIPEHLIKDDLINTNFPNQTNTELIITKTMHKESN